MRDTITKLEAQIAERRSEGATLKGEYQAKAADLEKWRDLNCALEAEKRKAVMERGSISMEALAIPEEGAEHFDAETARKIKSLTTVETKLALMPGIRVRIEAELEGLHRRLNANVKARTKLCRDLARERLEDLGHTLSASLLAHCGGDQDRSRAAAGAVVERSEAQRWFEVWQFYQPASDPIANTETADALEDPFLRGEPAE